MRNRPLVRIMTKTGEQGCDDTDLLGNSAQDAGYFSSFYTVGRVAFLRFIHLPTTLFRELLLSSGYSTQICIWSQCVFTVARACFPFVLVRFAYKLMRATLAHPPQSCIACASLRKFAACINQSTDICLFHHNMCQSTVCFQFMQILQLVHM